MRAIDATARTPAEAVDDEVRRWLAQAFAAERAPQRASAARVATPAGVPACGGGVGGFYWVLLALSLIGWLLA